MMIPSKPLPKAEVVVTKALNRIFDKWGFDQDGEAYPGVELHNHLRCLTCGMPYVPGDFHRCTP